MKIADCFSHAEDNEQTCKTCKWHENIFIIFILICETLFRPLVYVVVHPLVKKQTNIKL